MRIISHLKGKFKWKDVQRIAVFVPSLLSGYKFLAISRKRAIAVDSHASAIQAMYDLANLGLVLEIEDFLSKNPRAPRKLK